MATSDVVKDMSQTLIDLLKIGTTAGDVRLVSPDDFVGLVGSATSTLSVFLYRIVVNSELRNAPRRHLPDGTIRRQPLPLELNYLITAWAGDRDSELRLIGQTLRTLYDHSELGPADLHGASWEAGDTVQLVLDTLPIADHYCIWDANETGYRLSLPYTARVIQLTAAALPGPAPVVHADFHVTEKAAP